MSGAVAWRREAHSRILCHVLLSMQLATQTAVTVVAGQRSHNRRELLWVSVYCTMLEVSFYGTISQKLGLNNKELTSLV